MFMPTIKQLSIHLGQDPSIPFSPGQTISGVVRLNLRRELRLRSLKLDFDGHGETQFSEHQYHAGNDSRSIYYTATETYLQYTNILYPPHGENRSKTHRLPAGNHEYPFQLTLPTSVPPTFEINYGTFQHGVKANIQYSVTVQIDRPWRWETVTKLPFLVRGGIDLNTFPNMQAPMQTSQAKQITSIVGLRNGAIEAIVTVARPAFVIGEDIGLQVLVKNQSSAEIKEISAKLLDRLVLYGKHLFSEKTKEHKETLVGAKTKYVAIPPWSEQVIRFDDFVIPPTAPLTLRTGILTSEALIYVTVAPSGLHFYLNVGMPITIGAIPLVQQGPPMQHSGIFAPKSVGMPIAPMFPSTPPLDPSYSASGSSRYTGFPPPY